MDYKSELREWYHKRGMREELELQIKERVRPRWKGSKELEGLRRIKRGKRWKFNI